MQRLLAARARALGGPAAAGGADEKRTLSRALESSLEALSARDAQAACLGAPRAHAADAQEGEPQVADQVALELARRLQVLQLARARARHRRKSRPSMSGSGSGT